MSSTNWNSFITKVQDGEPINQDVANRAILELLNRTDWLRGRFESIDHSAGVVSFVSAEIASDTPAGSWVYFDESKQQFLPAIAKLDFSDEVSTYIPAESSLVVGLLVDKLTATGGMIVVSGGELDLPGFPGIANLSDLLEPQEELVPGARYFLSTQFPGKMTRIPKGGPIVCLGKFSDGHSQIGISVRDVFDSHAHRRFGIHAVPGASQNESQSGFNTGAGEVWVDHYYGDSPGDSSLIAIAHGRDGAMNPVDFEGRVDLSVDSGSGDLKIEVVSGADPTDPTSTGTSTASTIIPWPEYGEEVSVKFDDTETDLIFAFIRRDWTNANRYDNALSVDITGLAAENTSGTWKISLPSDYSGWANANPFSESYVAGTRFRYITEGQLDLFPSFPPVPVEGVDLYINGAAAVEGTDFEVNYFDLFWIKPTDNGDDTSEFPWPWDFSHVDEVLGEKVSFLSFTENPVGPSSTLVQCLTSASELLKVQRLGGDEGASTGKLQLKLELALAIATGDLLSADTVLSSINSDSKFTLSNSVAELVAGPNTKLIKINSDGSENTGGPFTGKIRVEAVLPTLQGEAVGIALFNAKESQRNGVTYTEFLKPSVSETGISARIKVPNFDRGSNHIRFRLHCTFIGESSTAEDQAAIFKCEYRIARPGVNLSSGLTSPTRIEAWEVPFADGYSEFDILPFEMPVYGSDPFTYLKQPVDSQYNLYADDLIEPNDIISVRIDRDVNSTKFNIGNAGSLAANSLGVDNYDGNVGLIGVRWTIELTE